MIKTKTYSNQHHSHAAQGACSPVPEFKRLKYFYGQMLGAYDFQVEQSYFRDKLMLHNRCLHGYGVICGLKVVPEPTEHECDPQIDKKRRDLINERAGLDRELARV